MNKFLLSACFFVQSSFLFSQYLTIDFSNTDTVSNMVGFLHAMSSTEPDDSLITPLKPSYWRAGSLTSEIYTRATNTLDAEYILVVSDLYGYPPGWTPPYSDTVAYKAFIDSVCNETSGLPMIYDIWNEPDGPTFWNGTQSEFFAIFQLAHDRIRENLGSNVQICGPSSANIIDTGYIRSFCDYCVTHAIQLDILSLHCFLEDTPLPLLQDILEWCRSSFMEDPAYASLGIQKIIVNEIVNEVGQYKPGFNLAHFYYLEKGKADGACRACWNALDGTGSNNCWNNTLSGLLTPISNNKRALWWAHKTYAELDSTRYETASSDPRVYSMTGNLLSNSSKLRAIVGYYQTINPLAPIDVDITLNNLNQLGAFPLGDSVEISIYSIPNAEFMAVSQPINLGQYVFVNSSSTITIPSIALDTNSIVYLDIQNISNQANINEFSSNEKISLFPNPANHTLFIKGLTSAENFEIDILDLTGKHILCLKDTDSVNLKDFKQGVYILKVRDGSSIYTERFVKQ